MVIIFTKDEATAKLAGAAAKGRRLAVSSIDHLMELVADERPSAVLLDARAGGSGARAVDLIPWILKASPLTAVVALTWRPTRPELEELVALGAYSWVDLAAGAKVTKRVRTLARGASSRRRAAALPAGQLLH